MRGSYLGLGLLYSGFLELTVSFIESTPLQKFSISQAFGTLIGLGSNSTPKWGRGIVFFRFCGSWAKMSLFIIGDGIN